MRSDAGDGFRHSQRTLFTYPSGRTINHSFYSGNHKVQQAATTYGSTTITLVDNLAYNPFGGPKALATGAGGAVDNQSGECHCLEVINPGQMMEQQYYYDNNGNLEEIVAPNTPWFDQSFTYDGLNRLETATGVYGTIDYTYDKLGNRQTRTVTVDGQGQSDTYSYVSGTSRLDYISGVNPATFSYDANGNITADGSRSFSYNQDNRLVHADNTVTGASADYTYNGLGQRVIKAVDDGVTVATTVFVYDFDGQIIAESGLDGSFRAEYLYMGGNRLAGVDFASGAVYYYLNNYLGTPLLLTDSQGQVVWDADYRPFGEAQVPAGWQVTNNFRFSGQYYDAETGLHYNYHRYYDPKTGRYLTPDPIGLAGGINPFVYAGNNSINLIDPIGLFSLSDAQNLTMTLIYSGKVLLETTRNATGAGILSSFPGVDSDVEQRLAEHYFLGKGAPFYLTQDETNRLNENPYTSEFNFGIGRLNPNENGRIDLFDYDPQDIELRDGLLN